MSVAERAAVATSVVIFLNIVYSSSLNVDTPAKPATLTDSSKYCPYR
jgi:hypothetical protein